MRTVAELMTLSGRKALLTGGAGHLGLAVGEALIEFGATLVVLDRGTTARRWPTQPGMVRVKVR